MGNGNVNLQELNSIRECASSHQTQAAKLNDFANKCNDPQIKQMFSQASKQASQAAQKLTQML
ncbi:MAG: hypothetical protein FWE20_08865 [Defluviitaleaceae bacterium]|nr:hypothetical protein [Defluviitaleaceae bacterium]